MVQYKLTILLLLFLSFDQASAQFEKGDFFTSFGGSWKSQQYRVKETLDREIDLQIGYYPISRMGVGMLSAWGLSKFSYAETNQISGVTKSNRKDGYWGGVGPFIRGNLGIPRFSVFGQMSALFGRVEQDSENNLAGGAMMTTRAEGNFQQYAFSAGLWYYFTRRFGAEILGSADWTFANITSGTVGTDGELLNANSARYDDTGGGWSLRLMYWFRLDKGAKKPRLGEKG
ncbi:MAG: hypothetical protein JNM31_14535 [Flavobacteriales bacterium]|nr:hypothetical protein [Flavobacteriales bacterium]